MAQPGLSRQELGGLGIGAKRASNGTALSLEPGELLAGKQVRL